MNAILDEKYLFMFYSLHKGYSQQIDDYLSHECHIDNNTQECQDYI